MRISLLLGLLTVLPAVSQNLDNEAAIGARLADEIRLQSRPLESPEVRAYADGIRQKLAEKLPGPGIPYHLELVSGGGTWALSKEPLVLPGGYIFFRADLILAAQNEAEFVGLLAHAMAHVAGRHFTWEGQIIRPMEAKERGRFEFEADLLAVQTARDAGYDPAGLVRYLNGMKRMPGTDSSVFAPPPRAARVAAMESAIRGFPEHTYESPDPEEFTRLQAEVRREVPPVFLVRPDIHRPASAPSLRRKN